MKSFFLSLLLFIVLLVGVIYYYDAQLRQPPPVNNLTIVDKNFGSVGFRVDAVIPPKPLFPLRLQNFYTVYFKAGDNFVFSSRDPEYQCLTDAITIIAAPDVDTDHYLVVFKECGQLLYTKQHMTLLSSAFIPSSMPTYIMFKVYHQSDGSVCYENGVCRKWMFNVLNKVPHDFPPGIIDGQSGRTTPPLPPFPSKPIVDPLQGNNLGNLWAESSDGPETCAFSGGTYQVTESVQDNFNACYMEAYAFSDFHVKVNMTINAGDCGGLVFRDNYAQREAYILRICSNGSYELALRDDTTGGSKGILQQVAPGSVTVNLNKASSILVSAQGSHLIIQYYADATKQNTDGSPDISIDIPDTGIKLMEGTIALLAMNLHSNATSVSFSEFYACNAASCSQVPRLLHP